MSDYLRVSDAERHEAGELLGRHFADGRLDHAEFDERLGGALRAKTRGDLAALLSDLPAIVTTAAARPQRRPPRRHRAAAALALALALLFILVSLASMAVRVGSARVGPLSRSPFEATLLPALHGQFGDRPALRIPPPPPGP